MSRFTMFSRNRRMLSCRRVGQALQAYLDGEVDELMARRIARHLEACRECGMELGVYTEIKASLRARGSVDPDALARLRSFGEQLAGESAAHERSEEESPGG